MFVHKVAKRQMLSSMRQPRQANNRNCASAAGESTIISHLFEGQLSYMTLCMHCDHQAHSTQAFTVLSLPIPRDTSKCSIQVTLNCGRCFKLLFCIGYIFEGHCACVVPCCLTVLALCFAGLPVTVLQADYPDRRGANGVFSVQAEERNNSAHLFGKTS